MRLANRAYLEVGNVQHEGWESVYIQRSIEQAAAQFTVQLTTTWPGEINPIRVVPGDLCRIWIGDDLVITGYVDRSKISHTGQSHTITVMGRSKTADIVDCSIEQTKTKPAQWKNRTILQIAESICEPFGINVQCPVLGLEKIKKFAAKVGASAFDVIEEVCRAQRLLITDNADGDLVLTRIGTLTGPAFIHPGNIEEATLDCDVSDRFSRYVISGQTAGDDENWGDGVTGVEGVIDDISDFQRYRLKVITAEKGMSAADAVARAKWEANARAGRSAAVSLKVHGWRDESGILYQTNRICTVQDEVIGVLADLLTVGVEFILNEDEGQITRLSLAPAAAYEPEPPIVGVHGAKKITSGIKMFEIAKGVR